MDREIKFRGLTLDGTWAKGDLIHLTSSKGEVACGIITDYSFHGFLGPGTDALCYSNGEVSVVNPHTVCQFTGLRDKNGNEIYEYDIISFDGERGYVVPLPQEIGFAVVLARSGVRIDGCCGHMDRIEVVGNIYNNPELISPEGK